MSPERDTGTFLAFIQHDPGHLFVRRRAAVPDSSAPPRGESPRRPRLPGGMLRTFLGRARRRVSSLLRFFLDLHRVAAAAETLRGFGFVGAVVVALPRGLPGRAASSLLRRRLPPLEVVLGASHPFLRLLELPALAGGDFQGVLRVGGEVGLDPGEAESLLAEHLRAHGDLSLSFIPDPALPAYQIISSTCLERIRLSLPTPSAPDDPFPGTWAGPFDFPLFLDEKVKINILDRQNYFSVTPPPHPASLYRTILEKALESGCRFVSAAEAFSAALSPSHVNVLVRHDVDHHPERTPLLCDIDLSLGIRPLVYVLVPGIHYRLEDWASLFLALRERGCDIGMHSAAYCFDDIEGHFRGETARFKKVFGFHPLYVSRHGEYPRPTRYPERNSAFFRLLPPLSRRLGYRGVDFELDAYRVSDAGLGNPPENLVSLVKKRQIEKLSRLPGGSLAVMNFHPAHWESR